MKISKKRIIIFIVVLAVIGGFLYFRQRSINKRNDVETAQIKKGVITEELILSGTILADEHVNLQFQASGLMSYVGVKEGDTVKKGKLVASLDARSLKKTLEKYLNTYVKTRNTCDQTNADNLPNIDPDPEERERITRVLKNVQMDLNNSVLDVELSDIARRLSSLTSPINGIVTNVTNPTPGVNINAGIAKFEIVNPQTIFFEVSADQTEVTQLKQDQKVVIILDSFPDKTFEGTVKLISYTPNENETGTIYQIKVTLKNLLTTEGVRLGMTGDARFEIARNENVFYVPNNFVKADNQGKYINLGSPSNKVYIETGLEGEEATEIKGDFTEGDTVYDL